MTTPPQKTNPPTALFLWLVLAASGCSSPEICDWKDNDRDGIIDENWDQDGDGWYHCGLSAAHQASGDFDCDDHEAAISPDAEEICNGVDDDCDGAIDPGCADISFQVEGEITSAAPWDLDADGTQDLILFTRRPSDGQSDIYASINGGDGTFESERVAGAEARLGDIQLLDWDGDGHVDIFGASVLGISRYQAGPEDYDYHFYALWDPDIDGWKYYALSSQSAPTPALWLYGSTWQDQRNRLWMIYEDENKAWHREEIGQSDLLEHPEALHSQDIDGDGDIDHLVIGESSLALWLTDDDGPQETQIWQRDDTIASAILLDVDSDGDLDLILSIPKRWLLELHRFEDGAYLAPTEIPSYRHPGALVAGEFNGDAHMDFAVASHDENRLAVYHGAAGQFTQACEYGITSSQNQLFAMDLNPQTTPARQDILLIDHAAGTSYAIIDPCEAKHP